MAQTGMTLINLDGGGSVSTSAPIIKIKNRIVLDNGMPI